MAGISVYDDFAHHPTAIETTLGGLRAKVGKARILAVLEPRSNTMKLGVHKEELAGCFDGADEVFFFQPPTSAGIWGGDGPHDPACPGIRGP